MKRSLLLTLIALFVSMCPFLCGAQISKNPYKFLGNITTYGSMDTDGYRYSDLWNQVTPENETKWSSVEGTRGSFNWYGADNSYNYAKNNKLHFKFHCFAWGSQYPEWITTLSAKERYDEIVKWIDAAKMHYPNLELIDVVNEALSGHQQGTRYFEEALGGAGVSGYDWIVNAFELVHTRWPDAILIYNDFNTFQWDTDRYIELVKALIDAGAPIDAYGCQSHDLNDMSGANLKTVMAKIQNALQIPMYITEYDINQKSDDTQLLRYKEQIPLMWESDYCAGVTIWGYIQGKTWEDYSGISSGAGKERPAMKWLREYMNTDKALTAGFRKNFPLTNGWTKEASVYVKPSTLKPCTGDDYEVTVRASMRTKTIDRVVLYVDKDSVVMKDTPYTVKLKAGKVGQKSTLKAIVYTTDGTAYTRYSHIEAYPQRKPFKDEPIAIPGTVKAADYDKGGEGVTFHNSGSRQGDYSSYRPDGVDIVHGNGTAVVGYTNSGEWMEYTVNVAQAGYYTFSAVASSGTTGSGFSISVNNGGKQTEIARINVPKTADNDWSKYTTIIDRTSIPLEAGQQILRITIDGANCNIDKVGFTHIKGGINHDVKLNLSVSPASPIQTEPVIISAAVTKPEQVVLKSVDYYLDGKKTATATAEPYEYIISNASTGHHTVRAVAIMEDDSESEYFQTAFNVRAPYRTINIPGTIEFENFDKGGDGWSFHDSDDVDEGKAGYRNDNEGLDIIKIGSGYGVGYIVSEEWMEYTVNVKEAGKYSYDITAASGVTGSKIRVAYKTSTGYKTLSTMEIPNTGGNNKYQVKSGKFLAELPEGQQIIRVTIMTGYGSTSCNLDKIKLTCMSPTDVEDIPESSGGTYEVFSLTGASAGRITVGAETEIADAIYQLTGKGGLFIVKNLETGKAERYLSGK